MTDDQPTWIGRTEIKELIETGETKIAGDTYELTGAARVWLENNMEHTPEK